MNWRKTQEFYLNEGYILPPKDPRDIPKPGTLVYYPKQEQLDFDKWESMVMLKDGKYRQRVGDATVYPIRTLKQLKRIRWIDGKEYLKSFWEFIGVDHINNRRNITIQDHEVYIRPEFVKRYVINKETGDQDERIAEVQEYEKIFTVEFSAEKVDEYLQGQISRRVALIVAEETETGTVMPREVTTLEAFKNSAFESLAYAPLPQQPQPAQAEPANAASARTRR
jgi:hypothetical protein